MIAAAVCSKSVLVVDDDPDIAELLCTAVQELGLHAMRAKDGDEALAQARSSRPGLVLLDIMMPAQCGWLVCAKLKLLKPAPQILLITALSKDES